MFDDDKTKLFYFYEDTAAEFVFVVAIDMGDVFVCYNIDRSLRFFHFYVPQV